MLNKLIVNVQKTLSNNYNNILFSDRNLASVILRQRIAPEEPSSVGRERQQVQVGALQHLQT